MPLVDLVQQRLVVVGGQVVPLRPGQPDIEQLGSKPGVEDSAMTSPLLTSITTMAALSALQRLVGQRPAPGGRW